MDQSRFDALTRRASAAISRRAGLLAIAGALFGLAAIDPADPSAAGKHRKRRKRTRMSCSKSSPCPSGMNCLDLGGGRGQCICADSGQPPCGASCCPQGRVCCRGVCCAKGLICGQDNAGNPVCACPSDGRQPCDGICCAAADNCYQDQCQSCKLLRQACGEDTDCCGDHQSIVCNRTLKRCCLVPYNKCTRNSDCCTGDCSDNGECQPNF